MAAAAQQEDLNDVLVGNSKPSYSQGRRHPEDRDDADSGPHDEDLDDEDEESAYRNAQIDAAMRMPTGATEIKLPPASFDSGCATGVKGVIADARAFQTARRSKWVDRARSARRSILGFAGAVANSGSKSESETDDDARRTDDETGTNDDNDDDEEAFLRQWRESRKREFESEGGRTVCSRRTSPSVRIYGRLDAVDALGYLDAIEKVGRETKVVVFVYDHECHVSEEKESALLPLVKENPSMHFVKVHYDNIDFDPAAVPSLLAYKNQGDLFANLTGIISMMPDDDAFGSDSLKNILQQHKVL